MGVAIDRVRVVDAHPPREVVPAYRDVSGGRLGCRAEPEPGPGRPPQRHWSALAEAETIREPARVRAARLVSRAQGEKAAFLAKAAAHMASPRRSPSFACSGTRWPRPCPAGPS